MANFKQTEPEYRPAYSKRWWRRGRFLTLLVGGALLLLIAALPTIITSRLVVNALIDRFGGLAPLQLDVQDVQAGWFKPVGASGIELRDEHGQVLAKIGGVTTEKGLIGWITNGRQLGTLQVSGLESYVEADQGTTNLEQALQPLLDKYGVDLDADDATANDSKITGRIELTESRVWLAQSGRSERWLLQVPRMSVELPEAGQWTGPISLQALVAEMSGSHRRRSDQTQDSKKDSHRATAATLTSTTTPIDARAPSTSGTEPAPGTDFDTSGQAALLGRIAVRLEPATSGESGLELKAKLENVPIDFWHVVHARLPEIPVEELQGDVSLAVAGKMVDPEQWVVDIRQFESRNLIASAPQLLGAQPASLQAISATGKASMSGGVMQLDEFQANSDIGSVFARAQLPWPVTMPTASNPFLADAEIDIQGNIDLARLATAAKSLLPMRADTQLLRGAAQFAVRQSVDPASGESAQARLTVSDLEADAAGQRFRWEDPLRVDLTASRLEQQITLGAGVHADFCKLEGSGTIESGALQGHLDLDLLQRRLSQFIELPIETMTGSAEVDAHWTMDDASIVSATANLRTTELRIVSSVGGSLREPAWNGNTTASLRLSEGLPTHLNAARIELTSDEERLVVDLQEPLALNTPAANVPSLEPANFTLNLSGDLTNWQRRGTMWLAEPPEMELSGKLELAVGGALDLQHVELHSANWRSQPLAVHTGSIGLFEPQMVGNFKGVVDTSNLANLKVQQLQVQATSFSLGAQDAAADDSSGKRIGRAKYLVDLSQLINNMRQQPAAQGMPSAPNGQLVPHGRVAGELNWEVDSQTAAFRIQLDGQQLAVLSSAKQGEPLQELWNEPSATAHIQGTWGIESGEALVDQLRLQTDWLQYAGNMSYGSDNAKHTVRLQGRADYDSKALTEKIDPFTGGQVQLMGRQSVPIEIAWTSGDEDAVSVLAELQAATRLGWERATVVGIDVGSADVPIEIIDGQLATAAEIPVSGGTLRWDLTSDLTAEQLVIHQKPMRVLENVAITPEMCSGWLKYVAPLLAEATRVDGKLSLSLERAELTPAEPQRQTVIGKLVMHNAQVGPGPLSNSVMNLVKQVDAIRKQDFSQPINNDQIWLQVPEQDIDFKMVDGNVSHENLRVRVGDAQIATSGTVNVNGDLQMMATMPIPDRWVEKSRWLAGLRGQSLDFPIGGTISSPRVNTDLLRGLGQQTVQGAAQGLLQQGLSRGLDKLFGPASPPPTNPDSNNNN